MLKICLVFLKSEPQYAYKRYAYKKNMYSQYHRIQRNTESGLFFNRIRKQCTHFGRFWKTGILSNIKNLYFEGRNTATCRSCGD